MMTSGVVWFLADESCDRLVIDALREDGYDVRAVSEVTRRPVDSDLLRQAVTEGRVLLTEDKDFGWLDFGTQMASAEVILLRFPAAARRALVDAVRRVVAEHGVALVDAFTVIQPGVVRFNRGPLAPMQQGTVDDS